MMRLRTIARLALLAWLLAGLHAPAAPIAVPEPPAAACWLDAYRARGPRR